MNSNNDIPFAGVPAEREGLGDGPGVFADAAAQRLRAVQASIVDLLNTVGLVGARPTEVSRTLGLDKTLAWKVSRFVEEVPAKAMRHMPGGAGVEIFCKAAVEHGASPVAADAVRASDAALREFMRRNARDRRTFEAMLAGEGNERLVLEERKAFYQAGSAVWGVRAEAQLLTLIMRPSESDPGRLDFVQLGGFIDLERLRADVPWIVRRLSVRTQHKDEPDSHVREPLDREPLVPGAMAEAGALALFPPACSEPLPDVRQFRGDDGLLYDELAPGPVGRHGAVSCVSGEVYRAAVSSERSPTNTGGRYTLAVRTPVRFAQFDVLIHNDLPHIAPPLASAYGLIEDRPRRDGEQAQAIPLMENAPSEPLGSPPLVQTTRLPAYAGWVSDAIRQAGWGGLERFRAFRMEMEYPPAPCSLVMRSEIRDR